MFDMFVAGRKVRLCRSVVYSFTLPNADSFPSFKLLSQTEAERENRPKKRTNRCLKLSNPWLNHLLREQIGDECHPLQVLRFGGR